MRTLDDAIAKYSAMAAEKGNHGVWLQVSCGGYGLAELLGYPDGAEMPDGCAAEKLIYLFGQEAFGSDKAEAYARAVRRIDGESLPGKTVTGVVL